ncbi:NAD-dependent epimerase/dehydratase family protein [Rhizobium lusitanum]|uniref:NAD-dependent epimerase/dehydratase family protein n=1 Tax=Rhizobium lusitanum TaxID=293958 RepID=A0A6L9UES8_9HYPH|nr:NAD(P)-dependent oxidoreductase [Rhizobium lusitanum]NEI74483.1 NAD-dependent epimerase/dehydratase family protein [Rhizobium lusitanum]
MSAAILVAGAAGLVGGAVMSALRRRGRPVIGIDLTADADRDVLACDLCDMKHLETVAKEWDLAAIVHCGAVSGPSLYREDPGFVVGTNIGSTQNLLDLARKRQIPRFVFASSASVYGPTDPCLDVTENMPLHPSSVYAATKIAGEALVEAYSSQYSLSAASLRIAAVYGPGRRTPCVIREMIMAAAEGRVLNLPVGGHQRYHYIHVDDVASAVIAALDAADFSISAYTIAADRGVSLGELAKLVREAVPGPHIDVEANEDPLSDPQGPYDLKAVQRDLAWLPTIELTAGIRSYAAWLLQKK